MVLIFSTILWLILSILSNLQRLKIRNSNAKTFCSSLAWCFTYYQATLKRGALDKDLAAIFYRVVLFLACLLQILGRIFIFVLFSYSFGKGMYYPLLIFLGVHIVIMSILHVIFSDAKKVITGILIQTYFVM